MILLLDAHVLIWALEDAGQLSQPARSSIADAENDVLVSAASVWELEMKRASGKVRLPDDLGAAMEAIGFVSVPVTAGDAATAASLPQHHRDPFDRLLITQALRLDAVVVTRDRAFGAYPAKILTA